MNYCRLERDVVVYIIIIGITGVVRAFISVLHVMVAVYWSTRIARNTSFLLLLLLLLLFSLARSLSVSRSLSGSRVRRHRSRVRDGQRARDTIANRRTPVKRGIIASRPAIN